MILSTIVTIFFAWGVMDGLPFLYLSPASAIGPGTARQRNKYTLNKFEDPLAFHHLRYQGQPPYYGQQSIWHWHLSIWHCIPFDLNQTSWSHIPPPSSYGSCVQPLYTCNVLITWCYFRSQCLCTYSFPNLEQWPNRFSLCI